MRLTVLLFVFNLHVFGARAFLDDLASRITSVFGIYRRDDSEYSSSQREVTRNVSGYDKFDLRELARRESYPLEAHRLVTEDGYILTLHRIPGRPGSVPVLLQHGLLESSGDWLIPGKGKSLPHILWEHGYDVWLGNARGNTHSKKHLTLSTRDPEFWNFSWHELGVYDLPAVITYITDLKGDALFYVGHSMAGSTITVMASERPEIMARVRAVVALAPANYVYHIRAPVKLLVPYWRYISRLADKWNVFEIFPRSSFFDNFAKYMCQSILFRSVLCSNSLFLIAGFNPDQLNYSLLPKIWSTFPAGTSVKVFVHWLQQMEKSEFRQFDHGSEAANFKAYNRSVPPDYDFSKLQVPVAVFWSNNDWLVTEKDVQKFYSHIPLKLGLYRIDHEDFNHFDFLWAKDAPELVYSKILDILDDCNNQIIR